MKRWLTLPIILIVLGLLQWGCTALLLEGPIRQGPYYYQILVLAGINIILAVSLNLTNGVAGQFSIGHAGFYAVGAYTSASVVVYGGPTIRTALGATPALLQDAMKNSAMHEGHWAFTQTDLVDVKVGKETKQQQTVFRFDPSKPYAEQFTPQLVEGHREEDGEPEPDPDRRWRLALPHARGGDRAADRRRLRPRDGGDRSDRSADAPTPRGGACEAAPGSDARQRVAEDLAESA